MEKIQVERVASALVREYLSRKGLKNTLEVLDEEMPRTLGSISNRQTLMKELNLTSLMKSNKQSPDPLRSMLEVMSKAFLEKEMGHNISHSSKEMNEEPVSKPRGSANLNKNNLDIDLTNGSSYMQPSYKPTSSLAATKVNTNDLVIEDQLESETTLGHGKAGLFDKDEQLNSSLPQSSMSSRSKQTPRYRGLSSGPITSSIDDPGRSRFNKARPLSASGRKTSRSSFDSTTDESSQNASPESSSQLSNQPVSSLHSSSPSTSTTDNSVTRKVKSQPVKENHTSSASKNSAKDNDEQPDSRLQPASSAVSRPTKQDTKKKQMPVSSVKVGDVEFGEVDDLDKDVAKLDLIPRAPTKNLSKLSTGKPIDVRTAMALKSLIFGGPSHNFNDEWKYQSFCFCDLPRLQYGIVQKKGGPCGILASVQACVLQEMFFGEKKLPFNRCFDPSREERSMFLALALSKILWRAGENQKAVVCIPSGRSLVSAAGRFKSDDLTETLMLHTFTKYDELLEFMKASVGQFELDGYSGVILVLYSSILSRTIERVKTDRDEFAEKLMGAHGYCTQEMVNLILTGRSVSNVFNDTVELESGSGPPTILKGLNTRCEIGLLSLFEHYKSCQVGTYFKTPKNPIWVVCSESHFSVLFSTKKDLVNDWKAERRFDLYYYDGLAKQQEEIKLTLDTTNKYYKPPADDDLIPPLELCVRTKWDGAEIDWNGSEPIL